MAQQIKCSECQGKYVRKKAPFNFRGQHIGIYDELVCNMCGDTVIESEVFAKVEKELKKRNLWGLRRQKVLSAIE